MTKQNYKGEKYFDSIRKLIKDLDIICNALAKKFKSFEKSYTVSDIIKAKSFNSLWKVKPNKHDNKYSKKEFKGIYAFATVKNKKIEFMYIGISQTIRRRWKLD